MRPFGAVVFLKLIRVALWVSTVWWYYVRREREQPTFAAKWLAEQQYARQQIVQTIEANHAVFEAPIRDLLSDTNRALDSAGFPRITSLGAMPE